MAPELSPYYEILDALDLRRDASGRLVQRGSGLPPVYLRDGIWGEAEEEVLRAVISFRKWVVNSGVAVSIGEMSKCHCTTAVQRANAERLLGAFGIY